MEEPIWLSESLVRTLHAESISRFGGTPVSAIKDFFRAHWLVRITCMHTVVGLPFMS